MCQDPERVNERILKKLLGLLHNSSWISKKNGMASSVVDPPKLKGEAGFKYFHDAKNILNSSNSIN